MDIKSSENCKQDAYYGEQTAESLPPEFDLGNVEYKLKLPPTITRCRFEHLVSQMKWRLMEGLGEAVYEIGVADDGRLEGLSTSELDASLATLQRMAAHLGASLTIMGRRKLFAERLASEEDVREVCEVLVRRVPASDQNFIDIRVSLLGDADAGKSTLLGVLASGDNDNGKGRARLNLFRHPHEILTGRTSSISSEIIGFDDMGNLVQGNKFNICAKSTKLLTLTDLCGDGRYLRTTISGLVGHKPDFVMLVISSVQFSNDYICSQQQLALARAVSAPVFMVLTKIDLLEKSSSAPRQKQLSGSSNSEENVSTRHSRAVHQCVRSLSESAVVGRRVPLIVESENDAVNAARNIQSDSILPVFYVSSKTGENMKLLIKFLNMLPPGRSLREKERLLDMPTVFSVVQWYRMQQSVGIVLAGYVEAGIIQQRDSSLLLGPDRRGKFRPVCVTSIHRYKNSCRLAKAGEAACVAIRDLPAECSLRKGLFLVHPDNLINNSDDYAITPDGVKIPGAAPAALIGRCCRSFRAEVQLYRSPPNVARGKCDDAVNVRGNGRMITVSTTPASLSSAAAAVPTLRTLYVGTHLSLHIGNIVQTAVVMKIDSSDDDLSFDPIDGRTMSSRVSPTMRKACSWVDGEKDSREKSLFIGPSSAVIEPASAAIDREFNENGDFNSVAELDCGNSTCDKRRRFMPIDRETAMINVECGSVPPPDLAANHHAWQSSKTRTDLEYHVIAFRFLQRPEFVILNNKLVLRQNRETIGVGKVTGFIDVIDSNIGGVDTEAVTPSPIDDVVTRCEPANTIDTNISADAVMNFQPMVDSSEIAVPDLRNGSRSQTAPVGCSNAAPSLTRRTHILPTAFINNDLIGFDSHSPLAQLDYLDD